MAFEAHSKELQGFFAKVKAHVKGFGVRVLVHLGAIGSAFAISGLVPTGGGQDFAFFSTYVGLICLVARNMGKNITWLLPAGLGLLQMCLCLALGFPLHQGIFWGGFQSYVQRLFAQKYDMGIEWIMPIFLVPLAFSLSAYLPSFMGLSISFISLASVGWGIFALKRYKQKQEEMFARRMAADHGQNEPEDNTAEKEDPFLEFHTSIRKLRTKLIFLPSAFKTCLEGLIISAEAIVLCMAEDERDTESGRRFLHRYLPAVHSVVDKYQKIGQDKNAPNVEEALKQSADILLRLEKAFAQEHENLLRNNVDDFSAELGMLDSLLKMEGR